MPVHLGAEPRRRVSLLFHRASEQRLMLQQLMWSMIGRLNGKQHLTLKNQLKNQLQIQLQQQALQIQQMKVNYDFQIDQANLALKAQDSNTKYDLQEEKQSHDAAMDLAELQLEEEQNRNVTI